MYSIRNRIKTHLPQVQARSATSNAIKPTILLFCSIPLGESPPPPPRSCFGRDELIENLVSLAENFTPIALIGTGGIGKTAVALTVLHHDRIKERFGENRRFIRCDQFIPSRTQFLNQLSNAIGAGVKNPDDLTPLRPFLSSGEMILVLDNAESILDPGGLGAQEIYPIVEELSQFKTICLCITSRIATVPRHCKRPTIPTLSMESACNIFYSIYDNGGQSDVITNLLRQLDFHALSITLLATTASHNMWDYDRLSQEWDTHHVQVLQTNYNESLAATIELSLGSPTFHELGPNACDLLGVIAFFPQGINESNLNWLFPTISNRRAIFDKFCVLSLTHRSNGFITMLAPLRDYLCPRDPASSSLLQTTKDCYFKRLSTNISPGGPNFKQAQWIISEDVNVEHLLDVFTTIDGKSNQVWDACRDFMEHLFWHKARLVMLGPKIEGLPDNHQSKPECLFELSQSFKSVGKKKECKQHLVHALKLWRDGGDEHKVAKGLQGLADANSMLNCNKEGIEQATEALEIYKRLDDKTGQAHCLLSLSGLFFCDGQPEAAEEATSQVLNLQDDISQALVCQCHRLHGNILESRGESEKAIQHIFTALRIASSFNWEDEQFWGHYWVAEQYSDLEYFDHAHAEINHAKSLVANHPYYLGQAMRLHAQIWCKEGRFEEAKSEALCSIDVFEKLGATMDLERSRDTLRSIKDEGILRSGQ